MVRRLKAGHSRASMIWAHVFDLQTAFNLAVSCALRGSFATSASNGNAFVCVQVAQDHWLLRLRLLHLLLSACHPAWLSGQTSTVQRLIFSALVNPPPQSDYTAWRSLYNLVSHTRFEVRSLRNRSVALREVESDESFVFLQRMGCS